MLFHARRSSHFGLGLFAGSVLTAACLGAAVMGYPPARFMAQKLARKGRRMLYEMMP
ncbi:MAG: hypothetical protein LBD02_05935 [Christensenellaceae bacterium]|nr:hypothetical protein [Christensenellaceae bacterium]